MAKVELIVTGKLEETALHKSISRALGSTHTVSICRRVDGFTSARLPAPPEANAKKRADKLVRFFAAEIEETDADLLLLVDDLELYNIDQPDVVVNAFRNSLVDHLRSLDSAEHPSLQTDLLTRGSFHLLKPMVESYFFTDAALLGAAGAVHSSRHDADRDAEEFRANIALDPGYFAEPRDCVPSRGNVRKCPWDDRNWKPLLELPPEMGVSRPAELHPKYYLSYLARESSPHEWCSTYDDAAGTRAMDLLDWLQILRKPHACLFARAMFEDVFDACNASWDSAWTKAPARIPTSLTCQSGNQNKVLRNI